MRRTKSPDRHLQKRDDGGWRYVRRVPGGALAQLRRNAPDYPEMIRRSLDTQDQVEARARRDAMEKADQDFWDSLAAGREPAGDIHRQAVERAKALKLDYRPAPELAGLDIEALLKRVEMLLSPTDRAALADAVLGLPGEASTSLDDAFHVFEHTIRKKAMARKSPLQRQKWRQLKRRGIDAFVAVTKVDTIEGIRREHGQQFYEWWLARIVPDDPKMKPLSASAGNKDMDSMRAVYGEYMAYIGREDVANPFRGLRFKDRDQRVRPAFSEAWIRTKLLAPGALDGLNDEARWAVLAMINTGALPSEIVNLDPDRIVLDAPIPHLDIRETLSRELKTISRPRRIPLFGVSLEAMKLARNGFPRYRDKDTLSATANKFLVDQGLMESDKHTLYSLRHAFEQRLKLKKVDEELRRYLMGHSIKRPKYGYSEDLRWATAAIRKIAL